MSLSDWAASLFNCFTYVLTLSKLEHNMGMIDGLVVDWPEVAMETR